MKKFSSFSATIAFCVAAFVFSSCQKEQSNSTDNAETAAANAFNEGKVVGTTGVGPYAGSIRSTYAASLASNYAKKFNGQTQSVAFSAKELITFLTGLQTKYKSDVIFVNFGVYGPGAAAVDPKNNGKLTVFFTGNNTGSSSSKRTDDSDTTAPSDMYLNHGAVWP